MVRAAARKSKNKYVELSDESNDEGQSSDDEMLGSRKGHASPPKKRKNNDSFENGSPKKSKKGLSGRVVYREDSEEDFTDAGEMDDEGDSDFDEEKPKKKTPAKRKSVAKKGKKGKKGAKKGKSAGRKKSKKPKYASSSEEESEEEEEPESDSEIEEVPVKQRKSAKQTKKSVVKKPELPKVGEMVVSAIKKLRDKPRKGSSLAAIKGCLAEEWGLYIPDYVNRIKKFLLQAVESGEIIQTKGKGAAGRFTVPGMKVKSRKKSKNKLTKKWDEEQEPEYEPRKTSRDEQREKFEVEMEMKREQRKEEEARRAELKASLPKKPVAPKKTEFEVELIKGMRVKEDKTWYLVKWEGWSKCTWEPEENVGGCEDLIDNFLIEEKTKLKEEEARRRMEEEEGHYEVGRILEVKFLKNGKREFMIRWKGHGPDDDTWEPEENLDCEDLIEKFMDKHERIMMVSEKSLRVAPTVVERLNYSASRRLKKNKRTGGIRVTYDDMCE